jgi:catechol 2,3-dioxygenase-like lactoylglutathione lyase family enzyme
VTIDFPPAFRNISPTMKVHCAIPVLQVKTIDIAIAFYVDLLGFSLDFQMRDYAGVHLGKAAIYLCNHTFHQRPLGGGAVTIVCDKIDDYYNRLVAANAPITIGAGERRYGMKDFSITDPDGNVLTFGCEIIKDEKAGKVTQTATVKGPSGTAS